MNTIANPYDALYTNLKNKFTVVHNGAECTVGDFMLMKAGKHSSSKSALPTTVKTVEREHAIVSIINYVNDKLTVKNPPAKDTTIKRFPVRSSLSAILSAVAACALIISCGIFALKGVNDAVITSPKENIPESAEDVKIENESNTHVVFN